MNASLVERLAAAQLPSPAARRAIRESANATYRDLAAELGVTPTTIMRWEKGKAQPRREHAAAYRKLLQALQDLAA